MYFILYKINVFSENNMKYYVLLLTPMLLRVIHNILQSTSLINITLSTNLKQWSCKILFFLWKTYGFNSLKKFIFVDIFLIFKKKLKFENVMSRFINDE